MAISNYKEMYITIPFDIRKRLKDKIHGNYIFTL